MRILKLIPLLVCLAATRLCAAIVYFDSSDFTSYGEFQNIPFHTWTDGGHTCWTLQPGQSLRFSTDGDQIKILSFQSASAGRTFVLYRRPVGGNNQSWVPISTTPIPAISTNALAWFTLATGLDTSTVWEYEILNIGGPFYYSTQNYYDAALDLGTGNIAHLTHAPRFTWGLYGDSLTAGFGVEGLQDIRLLDSWQFCRATDTAFCLVAQSGSAVYTTGRDSTGIIPAGVDGVRVEYLINDRSAWPAGQSNSQTAYTTMLVNIRSQIGATGRFGNKPIVCLHPLPCPTNTYDAVMDTMIQTAITNSGVSNVSYTNTINWISTDTAHEPDGIHPNDLGYLQWSNREIPIFTSFAGSTAIVITGPTTGVPGASTTFTATLANGATFTGDQDVTLTASSGTIDATAASGSISGDNTGTVTVTPASGATNFTFTVTPASTGTSTVTASTTQALWTMPASLNYTCSTPTVRSRRGAGAFSRP